MQIYILTATVGRGAKKRNLKISLPSSLCGRSQWQGKAMLVPEPKWQPQCQGHTAQQSKEQSCSAKSIACDSRIVPYVSWAVSVLPKLSVNRNTYYTPFLTEAPQLSKKWWPHCSLWAVFCHRILCLLEDELTCRLKFFICVICKTFSWRREARAWSFKRIKNVWLMLTLKSQA